MIQGAVKRRVTTAALSVLRARESLRTAVLRGAAARSRGLVLCYHSIARGTGRFVQTIDADRLDEQIAALKSAGDVVPLDWLLGDRGMRSRPIFALTFDDDDPAHVQCALPILQTHDVPSTFFLSGRSLHGLGPYWWTLLEQSIEEHGVEAACRLIGGRPGATLTDIVRACRNSPGVAELLVTTTPAVMDAGDIRVLANAGMTIGFHTLRHQPLTQLDDRSLREAVAEGRETLASSAGAPVKLFAYPYGTMDRRVASAVRKAGYAAAFALGNRAVASRFDAFCVPRWQPGPFAGRHLVAEAAVRLICTPG